jgi:hypothetical protein
MKGIIYKWTCNVNGKSYIGQTTNEKQREKEFLSENKPYAGEKINNARKKYGLSNGIWTKTVLKRLWCKDGKENELRERLNYWEKYYVELYDSINNGYNITNGGNCDFSQEVIEEMRRKSLEKWNQLSEVDKTRHRERSKNWWNNLSDEEKTRRKEKNIEYWNSLSNEEKKKHAEKGRLNSTRWWNNLSNEEKNKIISKSKERNDKWRKSLTEEERIKYDKAALGLHNGHSISRSLKSSEDKKGIPRSEETKKKIKESLLSKKLQYKVKNESNNPEGCYFIPRINRWRSTIYYKGEKRLLGHFETPQAASAIRKMAKQKKEEGIFDEWYESIHIHKIEIFKKFGEKTCN